MAIRNRWLTMNSVDYQPSQHRKRVVLFLGSGLSIPSGLPRVGGITNALFDEGWEYHTADVFFWNATQKEIPFVEDDWVPRVQPFLLRLMHYLSVFFAR